MTYTNVFDHAAINFPSQVFSNSINCRFRHNTHAWIYYAVTCVAIREPMMGNKPIKVVSASMQMTQVKINRCSRMDSFCI